MVKPLADWTNEEILEHRERLRNERFASQTTRELQESVFILQVGFARQQRLIERIVGLLEGRRG